MVVVQIFTLVLTTALLRHSERTISPAPSARFGGPRLAPGHKAGAPLALPVRHSANAIGQELVHGIAISRTVPQFWGGKTNVQFLFHGLRCFESPFKQAALSASVPSPLNTTKLYKNLSLEPHRTQSRGSAPMTSRHYPAR